jgi:hypothetical protein
MSSILIGILFNFFLLYRFHDHSHQQNTMMIPQQQTMIRMPLMPSTSTPTPTSTTPTQDRSGSTTAEHNNLMERTREDELLGTNATMSNVLYCNVNHQDLKQQFPGKKISSIVLLFIRKTIHFSLSLYISV